MAVAAGEGGTIEDQHAREIVFFDVETTVPFRAGQKHALLEFGAIVLDVQGFSEVQSYETLIKPKELGDLNRRTVQINGITKEVVAQAPTFPEVADDIYRILNGRIWAGHNIANFDIFRIREAFSESQRQAPEPAGIIDTYPLLKRTFGPRAGNLKLATLASYCGYGTQKHRSLDDVRMNLQVLRNCATMMFLESNYPSIFKAECEITTLSSITKESATLSVSQEQIRRSRNDFLPDGDGVPSELADSSPLKTSGSAGTKQVPVQNTRSTKVSSRKEEDLPSKASQSPSALTTEPNCANAAKLHSRALAKECKTACDVCCTSTPTVSDKDKAGKDVPEAFKDGSCNDDTLKVHRYFIKMDLTKIETASREKTKTAHSEVQRSTDHNKSMKDGTVLGGTENASITEREAGGEDNCELSAELRSLSLIDMMDAQDEDNPDISGIDVSCSHSMAQTSDFDTKMTTGVARESFLVPSTVSLDSIEFVDVNSQFGCKKALVHQGSPLRLWECEIRMRFSVNTTYAFDGKGKPRFSILIQPSQRTCEIISKCEDLVKSNMAANGGKATWLSLLRDEREAFGVNIRIGTTGSGGSASYTTKFYQATANGVRQILLGNVDVAKFRSFLPHGSLLDVGFGFDVYNIQDDRAGISLLAHHITLR